MEFIVLGCHHNLSTLSTDETKNVVHAYITSKLDQNNSLLDGIPDIHIKQLQTIQTTLAKLIYRAKRYDHQTGLLKHLHLLSVCKRIGFSVLLVTYSRLNEAWPKYLADLLKWHQSKIKTTPFFQWKVISCPYVQIQNIW